MTSTPASRRRNPAPYIIAVVGIILLGYYIAVGVAGVLDSSARVPLQGVERVSGDHLTLQLRVQDVDLTNRVIQANVLPVPHGDYVGAKAGEMSRSLRIEVSSGGVTTSVVTYPGESIVDPTAMSLALDRGDSAYPLDRPFARFQLSVTDDETGDAVPYDIVMENSARPWLLSGQVDENGGAGGAGTQTVTLDGARDVLSIALVAFYVLAILLTTLIAVVTIGSAILRRTLDFSNVIWLSATLLSFPALRSAMPGAPPIGTALDFLILFPCISLIAGLLVWTGVYLLWRESSVLRSRHLDDEPSTPRPSPAPLAVD